MHVLFECVFSYHGVKKRSTSGKKDENKKGERPLLIQEIERRLNIDTFVGWSCNPRASCAEWITKARDKFRLLGFHVYSLL
jgi:hypothetical protein